MSPRPIQPRITGGEDHSPGPDEGLLREALASWASGVAVVAVRDDDEIDAITVSAFTPVSLRPPLLLVCLGEQSSTLTTVLAEGRFTVNLLPEDAEQAAGRISSRDPAADPPFRGDAVLGGSMASFVCRLVAAHPGGDHRVVIGQVERVEIGLEAGPLLYFRREYRKLGPRWG